MASQSWVGKERRRSGGEGSIYTRLSTQFNFLHTFWVLTEIGAWGLSPPPILDGSLIIFRARLVAGLNHDPSR
jgi:hypothetical protein